MWERIEPQHGWASLLNAGDRISVRSPTGEQVADLFAFSAEDKREVFSAGRTIDYSSSIFAGVGTVLFSNRSRPMLTIVEDSAGRHDLLLTPCSQEMFEILYGIDGPHPSCFENLAENLEPFGIHPDQIGTTFNVFMTVDVDSVTGRVDVGIPSSKAGSTVALEAEMDLVIGVTACSAELSNNGTFKPIDVLVEAGRQVA